MQEIKELFAFLPASPIPLSSHTRSIDFVKINTSVCPLAWIGKTKKFNSGEITQELVEEKRND